MSYFSQFRGTRWKFLKIEQADSPYTWTRPHTGVKFVDITLVGGGAGGSGAQSNASGVQSSGSGGGGGMVCVRRLWITGDLTITIGAGGAGGSGVLYPNSPNAGTAGGDSTITLGGSVILRAYGGDVGTGTIGGDGGGPAPDGGSSYEGRGTTGGASGGKGGTKGYDGSDCLGFELAGTTASGGTWGGGGGGSFGKGGNGGDADGHDGYDGVDGGGGGGASNKTDDATLYDGGAGGDGFCLIAWQE